MTAWEPGVRFSDEQRRGPYRYWRHVHLFREESGGTLVEDGVDYDVPGGHYVHQWLVGPRPGADLHVPPGKAAARSSAPTRATA